MVAPGVIASQHKHTAPWEPPPRPAWMPLNTVCWFDAADPLAVITDGNGQVAEWKDNVAGVYSMARPPSTAVRNDQATLNGMPVVTFDGSYGAAFFNMTGPSISVTDFHAAGVVRTRSGGTYRCWMNWGGLTTGMALTQAGESGFSAGWGALVCYVEWWYPQSSSFFDVWEMQSLVRGGEHGPMATLYRNGWTLESRTINPSPAAQVLTIGSDASDLRTPCDIAELIIVSGHFTYNERDAVHNYLKSKWGIV